MRPCLLLGLVGLVSSMGLAGCSVTENGGNSMTIKTEPGPADSNAPTQFTTLTSGLKYRILRASNGKKPTENDRVSCNYKGSLDDGTVFDSSYRTGRPAEFQLKGVIPGWTQGLQLIGEGGMIELEIPYHMGYGEQGRPPAIPPRATLHFIVELERVL